MLWFPPHLGSLRLVFLKVEEHAAFTQAAAAIASTFIAAGAFVYAIRSLHTLQRQTEASISLTTETFRPIIEVLGGALRDNPFPSEIDFHNKGNGPALNFRWRVDEMPERWMGHTSNIIAPQEKGRLVAPVNWQKGFVLSYNSVAHREELLSYIKMQVGGAVMNQHEVRQGAALTRLGWTVLDPELALPGFSAELIALMPWRARLWHWWRLKRKLERRIDY